MVSLILFHTRFVDFISEGVFFLNRGFRIDVSKQTLLRQLLLVTFDSLDIFATWF